MKKTWARLLMVLLAGAWIGSFAGCEKLKVSNLKANFHLKNANKFYTDEKYRKAIDEYELALQSNPNLQTARFYLGTSYAMIYKPGDETERNKDAARKAQENLLAAYNSTEQNSGLNKQDIILALGDIFDKMRNFEEAEKYYKMVLEADPKDPKAFYVLANFYNKYDKTDLAIDMFNKRIALDPSDPEGYHYLASFYGDKRNWDKAIENHLLRIQQLEKRGTATPEQKEELAAAYYTVGVVYWNKSYQTPVDVMDPTVRLEVVRLGQAALTKATELSPNYPEPWSYIGLLYREQAKVDKTHEKELLAKNDEMIKKFVEMRKRKMAAEDYMKNLEKETK